jgi:hypothetical protein
LALPQAQVSRALRRLARLEVRALDRVRPQAAQRVLAQAPAGPRASAQR